MKRTVGRRIVAALILPGLVGCLALTAEDAAGQEEHRLRGSEVAVYNLAGTAEIVRGSGSEVVVRVMRGGDDAGRLEVGTSDVRGREALIIRYPADRVVYPERGRGSKSTVRVRSDGSFYGGGSGGDRVEIVGRGNGLEAWADLLIEVPAGKDFALYLAVGEAGAVGVDGDLLIDTGSGEVTAREIRGTLSIDTGSGSVHVWDIDGDLDVDTGSGEVEVEGVTASDVIIDTGSGEVTGADIAAGSLNVDTGSGEIDLTAVASSEIILDTGSGSVSLDLLEDVHSLEIDTGSGSVTVMMPASLGAQVEVDTGSGGIDVDIPLEVGVARRDYLRGVIGDGDGRIHIDTGSGTIRLIAR